MIAGKLNEKVVFQQATKVRNDYGEYDIEYNDVIVTRANVKFQSMKRIEQNNEIFMPNAVIFTIRSYHNISNDYIVAWNENKYRITSINKLKQQQKIEIIGELINE